MYAQSESPVRQNVASRLAPPTSIGPARTVDDLHAGARDLRDGCASLRNRLESLAGRLGHHPPKADEAGLRPAPNGSLHEVADTLSGARAIIAEASEFLDQIERHV